MYIRECVYIYMNTYICICTYLFIFVCNYMSMVRDLEA